MDSVTITEDTTLYGVTQVKERIEVEAIFMNPSFYSYVLSNFDEVINLESNLVDYLTYSFNISSSNIFDLVIYTDPEGLNEYTSDTATESITLYVDVIFVS